MNAPQHSADLVFWDVDTQFDFMTPPEEGGKLYVHDLENPSDAGATQIIPTLAAVSEFARAHDVLRVGTGDWHSLDHREIDTEAPDFRSTYPPHCMADEIGSTRIEATRLRDPLVLPLRADPALAWDVARRAVREGRDIFLRKEEFSCFTGNPATDALLRALEPKAIVVYGVALDVCVRFAVDGMLDRGLKVYLVTDATWGLGTHEPEALLEDWRSRGAELINSDQLLSGEIELPLPRPVGSAASGHENH